MAQHTCVRAAVLGVSAGEGAKDVRMYCSTSPLPAARPFTLGDSCARFSPLPASASPGAGVRKRGAQGKTRHDAG